MAEDISILFDTMTAKSKPLYRGIGGINYLYMLTEEGKREDWHAYKEL
jgi:hypothetical protein